MKNQMKLKKNINSPAIYGWDKETSQKTKRRSLKKHGVVYETA